MQLTISVRNLLYEFLNIEMDQVAEFFSHG